MFGSLRLEMDNDDSLEVLLKKQAGAFYRPSITADYLP